MIRLIAVLVIVCASSALAADDLTLALRSQKATASGGFERLTRPETWKAGETAVIVCDTWDAHHCLNAVRRLEEFAPRMNEFLIEARKRGATIIHSPSDCMTAYADHPARRRAIAAPAANPMPADIQHWCSRIPSEVGARYPIDQSDGGEDDDPRAHAEWAAKLKATGRNPNMPWKAQSSLIAIDAERDFISDRGDEVWNVLQQRGINNVILVGVHTNMCVLGRPFGLRQMVKNGKNAVLVRDLTDCMYNPQRWPFVDHFTGNDLIVSHVERHVCPTITSNQILGGKPLRSKSDKRDKSDISALEPQKPDRATLSKQWRPIELPADWDAATGGTLKGYQGVTWYRCAVRLPKTWVERGAMKVALESNAAVPQAWMNGHQLVFDVDGVAHIDTDQVVADEANMVVLRFERSGIERGSSLAPVFVSGAKQLSLKGRWQFRLGDDPSWSNMPLPAKFGISTDMLFEP